MAGDWMKVELELPDKPEIHYIAGALGIDADAVVGKLIRVWGWFDKHTTNGSAKVVPSFIDGIAKAPGMCVAMQDCEWLCVGAGVVSIPDFERHNGATAKKRSDTAKRVAQHRVRNADVTPRVTRDLIPRPVRAAVMEMDKSTCVYCDRPEGKYAPPEVPSDAVMCIDHIIPVSQGGANEISNMACACSVCNLFKSNRTPDECGLKWPLDVTGTKRGCNAKLVTESVTREEKRREEVNLNTLSGKPDVAPKTKETTETAKRVIDFLNAKAGKAFRPVPANINFVVGRLKEGATEQDCKSVIARKTREWKGTEQAMYLRPETLFNATKFAQYVGELVEPTNPWDGAK